MKLKIEHIVVGAFLENTYFLINEESRKTIIIDPGGSGREIDEFLHRNNLAVEMVINTHGHPDHVEANAHMKRKYGMPILIHPDDAELFSVEYDRTIGDGDTIKFNGEELKVIHTPGHTMGSICLLGSGFLLTGDTIFAGAMGRTDIGGDMSVMMNTLANKFEGIPDDTVLYPGHGPQTTMGEEKRTNMYMRTAYEQLKR